MWMPLVVIFDRPESQKPPRTNPLDRVPRIPKIMRVALNGIKTLEAAGFRSVDAIASLL